MDENNQLLREAKVRGCILIAQTPKGVLPPSCLQRDTLTLYAGDVIDALDRDDPEEIKNRLILCHALDRLGRADNDC